MYTPMSFTVDDATAWAFVRERAFGTVIAVGSGMPTASHVPLLVSSNDKERRLTFHLARANALHERLADNPNALIVIAGPDAYISPDWYVSADQVPTWNYVSVHLEGRATVLSRNEALPHVDALSHQFESRLAGKRPWTSAKMPTAKRDRMLQAIVPVEFTVERIQAQWKLGQHKTLADQENVLKMLEWQGGWQSQSLAQFIRRRAARLSEAKKDVEQWQEASV
jgi:transcriptional regulator